MLDYVGGVVTRRECHTMCNSCRATNQQRYSMKRVGGGTKIPLLQFDRFEESGRLCGVGQISLSISLKCLLPISAFPLMKIQSN
jgi:hypothetical protein